MTDQTADSGGLIRAEITFDPYGDDGPTWYCQIRTEDGSDPIVQADGPDALAAAMRCAEDATAQLIAHWWPEYDVEVMTAHGRLRVAKDGGYVKTHARAIA